MGDACSLQWDLSEEHKKTGGGDWIEQPSMQEETRNIEEAGCGVGARRLFASCMPAPV